MTPEGRVVQEIRDAVAELGGVVRKCEWAGRSGAPDLLIMLDGFHMWVEVKRPGGRPTLRQVQEHEVMRRYGGCAVAVVSSADEALAALTEARRAHGG